MPVAPEVAEKLKEMRKRLREAERLAGVKPDYRQPAQEPPDEPQQPSPEGQPPKTDLVIQPPTTPAGKANQVLKWIVSGASEFDVAEAIATTFPTDDQAELLLAGIRLLREATAIDPDTLRAFSFEATRDIYRKALEISDFPTALRALRQLQDIAH
jgi:hypothetical protein